MFSSSADEFDSDYEEAPGSYSTNDDDDTNSERELSVFQEEELCPTLGSVISTQTSLLGNDYAEYSDTSDSSTASNILHVTNRLQFDE